MFTPFSASNNKHDNAASLRNATHSSPDSTLRTRELRRKDGRTGTVPSEAASREMGGGNGGITKVFGLQIIRTETYHE